VTQLAKVKAVKVIRWRQISMVKVLPVILI